jgi:hypothetical protein
MLTKWSTKPVRWLLALLLRLPSASVMTRVRTRAAARQPTRRFRPSSSLPSFKMRHYTFATSSMHYAAHKYVFKGFDFPFPSYDFSPRLLFTSRRLRALSCCLRLFSKTQGSASPWKHEQDLCFFPVCKLLFISSSDIYYLSSWYFLSHFTLCMAHCLSACFPISLHDIFYLIFSHFTFCIAQKY